MGMYQMFYVSTARTRPGKDGAAADWWRESGQGFFETLPGVKSLRAFTSQFGLGDIYGIELWFEIENYAVMDRWDEVISAEAQKYGQIFQRFGELFETGPSRLVGSWPESRLAE